MNRGYKYKGHRYMFKKHRDSAQAMDRGFRQLGRDLKALSRSVRPRRRRRTGCFPGCGILLAVAVFGLLVVSRCAGRCVR